MIHFITTHWKSGFWLEPQLRQIKSLTTTPFKLYAFFTDVDFSRFRDQFAFASETNIQDHATKLNLLAEKACLAAESRDDLLVFLDSDAFPIAPWEAFVRDKLKSHDLVAVRRDENLGDPQPHPCFCVTSVKFWEEIKGDWRAGYKWSSATGEVVTDVGGNLLMKLIDERKSWFALTRSNQFDLHPVWFGIYSDIVYHHGAGSRGKLSRRDHAIVAEQIQKHFVVRFWLITFFHFIRYRKIANLLTRKLLMQREEFNHRVSREVEKLIATDPLFYGKFAEISKSVEASVKTYSR